MPMTDARLAQLAKRWKELKDQEKKTARERAELGARIMTELERRNTRLIETAGQKITLVSPEEVRYDFDRMVELFGTAKMRKVQRREVDKDELARAMTSGRLDPAVVAQCSMVIQKAPYLSIP